MRDILMKVKNNDVYNATTAVISNELSHSKKPNSFVDPIEI